MKIGIACRYTFRKKPARSMVHFDAVVDILKNVKPPAIAPKKGDGAVKTPYVPNVLGHWYYLAMQKSKAAPIFILVGGRLIARWGSLGGKFRDYCTDMTEFDLLLKKILLKVSESKNHENELRVLNQRYIELDDMAGIDSVVERGAEISVPWLLVHGDADTVVPLKQSTAMVRGIRKGHQIAGWFRRAGASMRRAGRRL